MERKVYEQMAKLDGQHWWFTARRRILDGIIERVVRPPRDARILELGAGTGHNLAMLSRFGQVEASELDPIARELASERLGRPVVEAALPNLSMFPAAVLLRLDAAWEKPLEAPHLAHLSAPSFTAEILAPLAGVEVKVSEGLRAFAARKAEVDRATRHLLLGPPPVVEHIPQGPYQP